VYKKLFITAICLTAILVPLFATGVVVANDPAAKATAKIDLLHVMSVAYTEDENDFAMDFDGDQILEQTIKTANGKDLFVDVSLQSAVFTATTVKSKNMQRDTSAASASVFLWVWIDKDDLENRRLAFPGPVVYNARTQVLTAVLQGYIESVDTTTGIPNEITVAEEIGLFIGTMSANSFNFVIEDLSSGTHTITVDAACASSALNQQGCAGATAVIGLGSMTVEEVRMIQGEDAVPCWWEGNCE
jgi:hypothetical protein